MEKENLLKTGFYGAIGLLGGSLGQLFGGFDTLFWALLTCSIIDYFSGGAVAIIFKNSPKTETGGAKSRIGFKGLVKKIFIYSLTLLSISAFTSSKLLLASITNCTLKFIATSSAPCTISCPLKTGLSSFM